MTSRTVVTFLILLCCICSSSISAWSDQLNPYIPTYYIDSETDVLSLIDTLSYYVDHTGELTRQEVEQKEFTITSEVPILNSREYFWFRLLILNTSHDTLKTYICDRVNEKRDYHINNKIRELGNGSHIREDLLHNCAVIWFNPSEVKEIYIEHWNLADARLATDLKIRSEEHLLSYGNTYTTKYVLIRKVTLSILAFMALLSCIFYLVFKESFLAYYTLYIFSFLLFYGRHFISKEIIPFSRHIEINLTYLIFPFYLLFLKHLFKTWHTNLKLENLITLIVKISIAILCISIGLQLTARLSVSFNLFNVYRLAMFTSIFYLIYLLLKYNNNKIAYVICIGNLFVLIPIFSTFLVHIFNFTNGENIGWLLAEKITPWGFSYYILHTRIGVVVEIIFFSIAIAFYLKQKARESTTVKEQYAQLSKVGQDILMKKKLQQDEFTNDLIQYIREHKEEAIKIDHLISHFGMGRTTLIQTIKNRTGQTPNQFITFIKLSDAKEELMTTGVSIKELSNTYGFSTPAHFSQQFKAVFGQSPKAFQSEISDNQGV